jgi:magnesium-transporting ATPase (P-type)
MLTPHLIWRISFVAVILMSGTIGLYIWEIKQGMSIEHARTVAVNTLVMFEIFYLFNSRYLKNSVFNWAGLTGNRYVLIAIVILIFLQLGFTYLIPMQSLFGTTDIDLTVWLRIFLVSSSVLFLVEGEKYFRRRAERMTS